ncbi:elongation factor P [Pelagerythrobacter sp.]|uniref:elongation factor P n=1 Tax=Pelagerythrobacter sp. TaxID=2800702 RepID=UPI0035AEE547
MTGIRYAIALASALAAAGAMAAPGGKLGTIPQGRYQCSMPGDAAGKAWRDIANEGFTIGTGSTYRTANGSGTYLLTGTKLVFTRGPLKGERFTQTGSATLRQMGKDGAPGRMRCVREGR